MRIAAIKNGLMAKPQNDRWHKKPTALFGGIAIYVGVAIPLVWLADFKSLLPHIFNKMVFSEPPSIAAAIWIGISLIFILGLLDDMINIKPHTKLVGEILVASLLIFLGFRLHWFTSLTLDTIVTLFWIVGITNAFNLIDNMDGLCTGVALIASIFLGFIFYGILPEAALVALILAGSLAAFLLYNFNPASIFMGDSGSLVIGFLLSMLSLNISGLSGINLLSVYAVPILLFMVPIFDTTLVSSIRVLSGRKASTGGKDHTSHRLVLMGFKEKSAVLFLYCIATISGMSAVFLTRTDTFSSPIVIIPAIVSIVLMGIYLAQLRVYPEKEFSRLRDKAYTPILIDLTYKRQLLLVTLDIFLIAFGYYMSYRLRFGPDEFKYYFKIFLRSMPVIIACKIMAFFWMGVYRAIWRYMSTNDVFVYIKASTVATILSIVAVTFLYRFRDFSKGIFLIDWLLATGFLLGTRGSFRLFIETIKRKALKGQKILIYGAGRGGEILLREILNNQKLGLSPVGFIDDDKKKVGKKIQGYPILGTIDDIETFHKQHQISGLLISFMKNNPENNKAVKRICSNNYMFLKKFSIELNDVEIE